MDYSNFIGFTLFEVEEFFKKNGIDYFVTYVNSKKEQFDNFLVVNIKQEDKKVNIIVDRFLINI